MLTIGPTPELTSRLNEVIDGSALSSSKLPTWTQGFLPRLLAGFLALSIAVAVGLSFVLTARSSQSLVASTQEEVGNLALGAALRLDTWVGDRQSEMEWLAVDLQGHLDHSGELMLQKLEPKLTQNYDAVEVIAGNGTRLFGVGSIDFQPGAESWFSQSLKSPVITPITIHNGVIQWSVTAPVASTPTSGAAVVVGDLRLSQLSDVLQDFAQDSALELHVVNADHKLVYSTDWGAITDDAELIKKGMLTRTENTLAVKDGLGGKAGAVRTSDYRGTDVISGYAMVQVMTWALIASEPASIALAPVDNQVLIAVVVTAVAILIAATVATLLARSFARPLSHSATRLSTAAGELAAATTEQTAAATETSASMEELARTSASIAETLQRVSVQAQETRENLEQAQADMQASGTRTLALAERVNDVNEILNIINEIADQTNLLALNAAIEAARAGETGRGFAVVADEVRRLAERSKSSAGKIAKIIENARSESNATVMAMEQSTKQMQRGLKLLEDVVDASSHVQVITQQQRSATEQVLEAMEQIAAGSRQVSTTAQDISKAAVSHATLAGEIKAISHNGSGRP